MRAVAFSVALVSVVWVAGCSNDEPKRFRVSGDAKFNGAPIPFGDILFTPDGSKQNSGPQGFAHIRNGKFDTTGEGGKGFAGGPTIVRVTGFSGPMPGGTLLCEYEYAVDLPRGDATHDVQPPPAGGAPKKKAVTPEI